MRCDGNDWCSGIIDICWGLVVDGVMSTGLYGEPQTAGVVCHSVMCLLHWPPVIHGAMA